MIVPRIAPDLGGMAELCHDMATTFQDDMFDVTVLSKSISKENQKTTQRYKRINSIIFPPKKEPIFLKLVHDTSHALAASLKKNDSGHKPYDLVWVIGHDEQALDLALQLKRQNGIPIWLHAISGEKALQTEDQTMHGLKAIIKNQNPQRLIDQVDVVSACTQNAVQYYKSLITKNQPVIKLRPWVTNAMQKSTYGIQHKGMQQTVRLLFAGEWEADFDLLRFCKILRNSPANFRLKIMLTGEHSDVIRHWVKVEKDERFEITDYPLSGIPKSLWEETDLFILPHKERTSGLFLPTFFHTALLHQTPILAIADENTALYQEMSAGLAGPVYSWEQMDEVDALLQVLPEYPSMLMNWQENASKYKVNFNQKAVIKRYKKIARTICG